MSLQSHFHQGFMLQSDLIAILIMFYNVVKLESSLVLIDIENILEITVVNRLMYISTNISLSCLWLRITKLIPLYCFCCTLSKKWFAISVGCIVPEIRPNSLIFQTHTQWHFRGGVRPLRPPLDPPLTSYVEWEWKC